MPEIRVAIAGVGNCASALVQGVEYYRARETDVFEGLMHANVGGWAPSDIEFVAAFDVDRRKVGRPQIDRLIGIDEHVHLDIGAESVRATFDDKQFEEDRVSAVQYIRFPLGPELARQFRDPNISVELRVDHPNYEGKTAIEGEARASLSADLA